MDRHWVSAASWWRLCMILLFGGMASVWAGLPSATGQGESPRVLVHYMPWYASKPVSGEWGWHWTMDRFNPEKILANGQREIASHDYPLIGPYDSGDEDALECQVLLMKFAGLNGVVIDWYGIGEFRDYAIIHRNTQRLVVQLKRAGLQYAICYEDQSVKHMVESGHVRPHEAIAEGSRAFAWLKENCFGDTAYVTLGGRPILIVFGPQYFSKAQWQAITSGHTNRPMLFGLPHVAQNAGMDGAFGWPPVTGGGEIARETWGAYLRQLESHTPAISVVFPAFHDIYREAGLHDSYGFIDGRDGQTMEETFAVARSGPSPILQIATWNDYGEGTVIEPTVQHGYRYLEFLQRELASAHQFTAADIRLPIQLYELRKKGSWNTAHQEELQRVSALLFAGKCEEARMLLEAVVKSGS